MSRSALPFAPLALLLACTGAIETTDKNTVPTDEADADADTDADSDTDADTDADTDPATPPADETGEGCGCRAVDRAPAGVGALALIAALARVRRRSGAPTVPPARRA